MDNKDYIDELFENLKRDNLPLFCLLSKGNPGACMVLISLFKEIIFQTRILCLQCISVVPWIF